MCGIAGIVGGRDMRSAMERMLASLQHRGPDGEGIFITQEAALGHRRLAIIDVAGGKQPLTNADDTIVLVCNGEIYNYRALREACAKDGYRFRTQSDCEVIIPLYEKYGDRLVDHLRGMFAFILWDAKRRRLLAARDHLGQKPLFYTAGPQGFACASEIKALLASSPATPRLNLAALDQYFALRLIDAPLTMFEGIFKLPPGHTLVVDAGSAPQIHRYWDLPEGMPLTGTEDELCDELEALLDETLQLHRVSDVPVGAFLSSGIDSSLLVALLSRKAGATRLPTFTMGLDYQRFDEAPGARAVAAHFGTDHHEARLRPVLSDALPALVHALDEPSDPLSSCTYQLAAFTRRHVKVVIGGDGGDELFGGYDRYYGNLYAGRYARIPAAVRRHLIGRAINLVPESGWYKSAGHQLRWLQQLSFHGESARYAASLSYFYFDAERRRHLFAKQAQTALANLDAESAIRLPYESYRGSALAKMLYADSKVRLPNHPVTITDRICMAHGLEVRSPFMDHKLAEFAARLPDSLKVRGRSLRYLQLRLAARYLPREVLSRPKQGFSSALPYMLRDEYAQLGRSLLSTSRLVRDGVLDSLAVGSLVSSHLAGESDHGNRLWLLINAEAWYRLKVLHESLEEPSELTHDTRPPQQARTAMNAR